MPDQFGSVWSSCCCKWSSSKVIRVKNQYPIAWGNVASSAVGKLWKVSRLVGLAGSWKVPFRLTSKMSVNNSYHPSSGFSGSMLGTFACIVLLSPHNSPVRAIIISNLYIKKLRPKIMSLKLGVTAGIWAQDLNHYTASLFTISQGSWC